MSKEVKYLQRRPLGFSRLPKEITDSSTKTIGSYYDVNNTVFNPFPPESEEEKELLLYKGWSPNDLDVRTKITKFWAELAISVPAGNEPTDGYKFDLSKDPTSGKYRNYLHYLQYLQVKDHPQVVSYDAYQRGELDAYHQGIDMFVLIDPSLRLKDDLAKMERKDKAYELYMGIKDDKKQIILILELLASKHRKNLIDLEEGEIKQLIRDLSQKDDTMEDFIAVVSDPNLMMKAKINRMVSVGTLTLHGNAYYDRQEKLGSSLEDTVVWFKDAVNNAKIEVLNERYQRDKSQRAVLLPLN